MNRYTFKFKDDEGKTIVMKFDSEFGPTIAGEFRRFLNAISFSDGTIAASLRSVLDDIEERRQASK